MALLTLPRRIWEGKIPVNDMYCHKPRPVRLSLTSKKRARLFTKVKSRGLYGKIAEACPISPFIVDW